MDSDSLAGDWPTLPLGECVDVLDRLRKPVNAKDRQIRPGPVPYYGATGQVGWIDQPIFDEELVLLGEDGAPFLDKSKPIAYVIDGPSWVNNHAHVLRARPGVTTNRYIKHYLDSFDFTDYVQGSTRDKLNQGDMKTIPVLLPPLNVQDRLVSIVDGALLSRTSASDHLAAAVAAVERFKRAVLAAACSGRLTADWRDARGADVIDGSAQRSVLPVIDSPDSWPWTSLGEIADIRGGVQVGAKRKAELPLREVPYLRVANVQRGYLDLTEIKTIAVPEAKISELRLAPGDIFFNEGGDRDKLGRGWIWEGQIEECIHQNHVFRARLRDEAMEPRFFSWYGNTFGMLYFFDEGKQTVNLASLSKTKLSQLPVPVPSTKEQTEIVRRVDTLLRLADPLLARLDEASRTLDRSSQAVLAKAFRGDLVGASR